MVSRTYDIPMSTIKYLGPFDLQKLLKTGRDWLDERLYDFEEPTYKHKVGGEGAEVEVEWLGKLKVNVYVKNYIEVRFHIRDMKDVEVVRNGEKLKMQYGRVLIESKGRIELDWGERFKGNKFLIALQDFYHNYIIKRTIFVKWWDNLYYQIYELNRVLREQLGFESG
ncbi:hypothetical protein HY642_00395 [Candidatus Woesearchaeota archaeon]|nr:hypothetical protein [Candidatus Woesearchaeota archaeon]